MAVPRSGWMKTRTIGPAAKPIAESTVLLSPIRFARSADVVVRVAADVVPGDARASPEPVSHARARGCEQDPVEAPDDRRGCDCLFAPASEAARPGIDGLNHSSSAPRPGLDAS